MEQKTFENKIKPLLLWMGTIVAAVMAVAYVIVVFVLIEGFKAKTILNTSIFSLVTAIIGFCIMQMLKIQGQSFAKSSEENQKIIKEYTRNKTKDKKSHSLKYYWLTSATRDILTKCLMLALTSVGIVYIMIEGTKDYSLLLLAGVNLLMFAGFGLIQLVKAYEFYNESYVPYMLEKIKEAEDENREKENKKQTKKGVGMGKKKHSKQRNVRNNNTRRDNVLESSVGVCSTSSDSKSVVLDNSDSDNSVLGGPIYTSNIAADSVDNATKEIIQEEKETC